MLPYIIIYPSLLSKYSGVVQISFTISVRDDFPLSIW